MTIANDILNYMKKKAPKREVRKFDWLSFLDSIGDAQIEKLQNSPLNKKLRLLMNFRGWRVPELVKYSGVSEGSIYGILRSSTKTPLPYTSQRLADGLGIPLRFLTEEGLSLQECIEEDAAKSSLGSEINNEDG